MLEIVPTMFSVLLKDRSVAFLKQFMPLVKEIHEAYGPIATYNMIPDGHSFVSILSNELMKVVCQVPKLSDTLETNQGSFHFVHPLFFFFFFLNSVSPHKYPTIPKRFI